MSEIHKTPNDAEASFYRAFSDRDAKAMQQVWQDDALTMCMHPGGGLLQGTEQILKSWEEILSNAAAPELHYELIRAVESSDIAVHTVQEGIKPADSEDPPTIVFSTNVYRKSDLGWQMISHHASLPLFEQQERADDQVLH